MAQSVDRTKPPETPALPAYKLPPVYETKLPNGLTVVLVEDRRFPLVTVRLSFLAGSKFDPQPLPGLAESVAALLTEGTAKRSGRQIAEEMASIGGDLNGRSSADVLTLSANALAENSGKLIEIVADAARNASFPEEEVQLRKQNRKQELMAQRSTPDFLLREKFNSVVYGGHPYSRVAPTVEALDQLDRAALAKFRDTHLAPNNATLILLGGIPPREETLRVLRQQFGDWKSREVPAAPEAKFPKANRQIVLVDRPGSVQADIRIGQLSVTRTSPDYFPLTVGNTILGGGASSRLFNDVREKKGYAYSVYSHQEVNRDAGYFAAATQVRNEVVVPALETMLQHLEAMGKEPVTKDELTDVKNYLSGRFVMGLETQGGLAEQLNSVKTMGLGTDYLEKYTARIRSVEPNQIQRVGGSYISPDDATIVVVGDAAQIAKPLEKFGKVQVTKVD